jgi:hypothetical protein
MDNPHLQLAQTIADRFAQLPLVEAVSLTGSWNMGVGDAKSDIDLYVFSHGDIPVEDRMALAIRRPDGAEFDNRYWGTADTWYDLETGIRIEPIYWWTSWLEGEIDRVLHRYEAWTGYTTAFWHSIRSGRILFDRSGWLARLHAEAQQPYPEALRRAIIAKNQPTLRILSSSYLQQLESALRREDIVSLNHRTAALLAGYFDVLFALNYVPHPGEKRLLHYAETLCPKRPPRLREQVEALIASAGSLNGDVITHANTLLDSLDVLLLAEGFDPNAV